LALPEADERRVRQWLKDVHAVDLGVTEHGAGHPLSARCVDRLRWAGAMFLSGRITTESAQRRVMAALRDDAKWWLKHYGEEVQR
jgi:hypothetical protein